MDRRPGEADCATTPANRGVPSVMFCLEGIPGSGKTTVGDNLNIPFLKQDRQSWGPALKISAGDSPAAKLLAQLWFANWYKQEIERVKALQYPFVAVESSGAATSAYADYHQERFPDADVAAIRNALLPKQDHPFKFTLFLKCSPAVAAERVHSRAVQGDDVWSFEELGRLSERLEAYVETLAEAGHPVIYINGEKDLDEVTRECISAIKGALS